VLGTATHGGGRLDKLVGEPPLAARAGGLSAFTSPAGRYRYHPWLNALRASPAAAPRAAQGAVGWLA